jgi:hypothetical protein
MRKTVPPILAAAVTLVALASVAGAQRKDASGDTVVGVYDVRYEEVSTNCTQTSITLTRGTLDISIKNKMVVVDIHRFPLMSGSPQRGGKIRAKSKAKQPSSIEGVKGTFSVAGRVDEGLISLVFVAEYFAGDKALCSQTWNVSGAKSTKANKTKEAQADPVDPPKRQPAKKRARRPR